jgi:hypothetical protein
MAEGPVNHFLGERWEAHSTGTEPMSYVHSLTTREKSEVK